MARRGKPTETEGEWLAGAGKKRRGERMSRGTVFFEGEENAVLKMRHWWTVTQIC